MDDCRVKGLRKFYQRWKDRKYRLCVHNVDKSDYSASESGECFKEIVYRSLRTSFTDILGVSLIWPIVHLWTFYLRVLIERFFWLAGCCGGRTAGSKMADKAFIEDALKAHNEYRKKHGQEPLKLNKVRISVSCRLKARS